MKDVGEKDCEAGKEWQWVPRAGTCITLSLGIEISNSTVVLIVLANLNCKIEDVIWLHSVLLVNYYISYQHASIFL